MPFNKIEDSLQACSEFMNEHKDDPSIEEIELRLVGGLTILIVSEYESLIEKYFITRSGMCGDRHLDSFVTKMISEKFRSPDISKITETLGKFGQDYKNRFTDRVINTEVHAAWDNIMKARHYFVHKKGSIQLTLPELSSSYNKTKILLSELKNVLGVTI